jgi:hypothetical protein
MIKPLLITLLPVVHCAWLPFESMDSCVLGTLDRYRVQPLADSSSALRVLFLSLNSPPTALHITHTLVGSTHIATDQQSSLQSP